MYDLEKKDHNESLREMNMKYQSFIATLQEECNTVKTEKD